MNGATALSKLVEFTLSDRLRTFILACLVVGLYANSAGALLLGFALGGVWVWRSRNHSGRSGAPLSADKEVRALMMHISTTWPDLVHRVRLAQPRLTLDGRGLMAFIIKPDRTNEKIRRDAYGTRSEFETPRLRRMTADPLGVRVDVELLHGQDVASYERVAEALAAAWRVREVRVAAGAPGIVTLLAVIFDPLAQGREVALEALPQASTESVTIGRLEDGSTLDFSLDQVNSVVGGLPGSGKSVLLNVLLAGASQRQDVQIIGIDCKRGIEFFDWQPRLADFAIDQESAIGVLERVSKLGEARLDALRGSGFKSQSRKGYTADDPLIMVVIDEVSELFESGSDRDSKARAAYANQLVSRGVRLFRAAGITYVMATQKPTVDVLSSQIRDNCSQRIASFCKTDEQSKAILGPEVSSSDVRPTKIPKDIRGTVVVGTDRGEFAYGRVDFIDEETSAEVARRTSHLRRDLGDLFGEKVAA